MGYAETVIKQENIILIKYSGLHAVNSVISLFLLNLRMFLGVVA